MKILLLYCVWAAVWILQYTVWVFPFNSYILFFDGWDLACDRTLHMVLPLSWGLFVICFLSLGLSKNIHGESKKWCHVWFLWAIISACAYGEIALFFRHGTENIGNFKEGGGIAFALCVLALFAAIIILAVFKAMRAGGRSEQAKARLCENTMSLRHMSTWALLYVETALVVNNVVACINIMRGTDVHEGGVLWLIARINSPLISIVCGIMSYQCVCLAMRENNVQIEQRNRAHPSFLKYMRLWYVVHIVLLFLIIMVPDPVAYRNKEIMITIYSTVFSLLLAGSIFMVIGSTVKLIFRKG